MKRGTIEHPKTARLAELLKIDLLHAVGILESLWHFTSRFAPQANIGKFTDKQIAVGIKFTEKRKMNATHLLDSLVQSGFIDKCLTHRLIVHDWEDHTETGLKKTLANNSLSIFRKTEVKDTLCFPNDSILARAQPSLAKPSLAINPLCDAKQKEAGPSFEPEDQVDSQTLLPLNGKTSVPPVTSPPKVHKKPKSPKVDPPNPPREIWLELFRKERAMKPVLKPHDPKNLWIIFKDVGEEKYRSMVRLYLQDTSPFVLNSGWSVGVFFNNCNNYKMQSEQG